MPATASFYGLLRCHCEVFLCLDEHQALFLIKFLIALSKIMEMRLPF